MARQNYRDVPELKEFFLSDARKTGKRLGSGAFGIVEELNIGGTVCAGKMLHKLLLDEQNEGADKITERFVSECALMSKVRHPNIVQFMGICQYDASLHPVLVMEEVDTSLDNILNKHENLPFPLILHILHDITKGLIYLHDSQKPPIIHRDLTARNVLIDKASMKAKIADLGNALMIDPTKLSLTLSQAPGTLPYMPPEALEPNPNYDTSLDMFSFGHLALFAVLQMYPGELLPSTYCAQRKGKLIARSEVERRKKYFELLVDKLTEDHLITKMIKLCLHNTPSKRYVERPCIHNRILQLRSLCHVCYMCLVISLSRQTLLEHQFGYGVCLSPIKLEGGSLGFCGGLWLSGLKQGGLGSIPGGFPGFFSLPAGFLMFMG